MVEDYTDPDRQSSVLTSKQRKLLSEKHDSDLSSEAKRMARRRIRKRVESALLDFRLIAEQLDSTDREQIFEELLGDGASDTEFNVEGAQTVGGVIEFLYAGTTSNRDPPHQQELFRALLEPAVERVENRRGMAVKNVELVIDTELTLPWDKLESEIEQRGVTPRAKRSLEHHLRYNKENIDIEAARNYLDEYYGIA